MRIFPVACDLKPVPDRYFDTDDLESCGVTKTFRVRFDRNVYGVP